MKSIFKFAAVLAISGLFAACSSDNAKQPSATEASAQQEADFRNSLGSQDSLAVVDLGTSVMELLKAGQMEEAFASLHELAEDGTVAPLSAERKKQLTRQFRMFPVQDYKLREVVFNTAEQNIVTYDIVFDQAANAKTSFALSPVKQGSWYLTVRSTSTADGHDTKAEVVASEE